MIAADRRDRERLAAAPVSQRGVTRGQIAVDVDAGCATLRLGVIVLVIALLQQTEWFSIVAFISALIPATVGLLVVELKLLTGRMQADLWVDPNARGEVAP